MGPGRIPGLTRRGVIRSAGGGPVGWTDEIGQQILVLLCSATRRAGGRGIDFAKAARGSDQPINPLPSDQANQADFPESAMTRYSRAPRGRRRHYIFGMTLT